MLQQSLARPFARTARYVHAHQACRHVHSSSSSTSSSSSSGDRQQSCTAVYLASTERHMQRLAELLARSRNRGDCYCLFGAVGAGKSVFRAAAGDPQLPVPSPTYLLQQMYEEQDGPPIHHFDLYRLTTPEDMDRLNLAASWNSAVSLVEWADRLPQQLLPVQRLEINIEILDSNSEDQQQMPAQQQQFGTATQQQLHVEEQWLKQQQQQERLRHGISQVYVLQADLDLPTSGRLNNHKHQWLSRSDHDCRDVTLVLPISQLADAVSSDASLQELQHNQQQPQQQQQVRESTPAQTSAATAAEAKADDSADKGQDPFTDKRWRQIRLRAVGPVWAARLQQLALALRTGS
eukprot:GHRR01029577.1.p1 GENE.GHRR01029577.1~~GHRR01029577.1.p1  ORF type:complete len:349 (+),score=135.47 GHRR01029577.1:278-1324(+)